MNETSSEKDTLIKSLDSVWKYSENVSYYLRGGQKLEDMRDEIEELVKGIQEFTNTFIEYLKRSEHNDRNVQGESD